MGKIKIINPGLLTSIQDRGRWGYQKYGIPVAGSMDDFSHRLANILVGNQEYCEVLEATVQGPEIQFLSKAIISICGGNMEPRINGEEVPMWTSLRLKGGDILKLARAKEGARTYIAFAGGIDVEEIMGSKSTYLRGEIGGYKGRQLRPGDQIGLNEIESHKTGLYLPKKFRPNYESKPIIRLVLGPQDDYFSQETLEDFLKSKYTIRPESDRMAYRLSGKKLIHKKGPDIISDGMTFGSIQVPGHGQPIIMMADRPASGGYTKIATVITSDLPKLGQMMPGDSLYFKAISLEEAHRLYRDYEEGFSIIRDGLYSFDYDRIKKFNLKLGGISYKIGVSQVDD